MAVKPTPNNSLYKGFTFDGIDSRDYGVYISGDAVFDSPERDVEMIEIPGRNGSFALDKGRFGNITVSYPAGLFGEDEASFREGIRALRNALASRKGYCRLEDDYNPNEYRMAVYKKGLEVDPALLKAGEFTIEFDCMPQRWLKSGETAVSVASGGQITNPTLFESHPLLQVWGYGDIVINGESITINDHEIGTIVLANEKTASYTLLNRERAALLRDTDIVTLGHSTSSYNWYYDKLYTFTGWTHTSTYSDLQVSVTQIENEGRLNFAVSIDSFSCEYADASEVDPRVALTLNFAKDGTQYSVLANIVVELEYGTLGFDKVFRFGINSIRTDISDIIKKREWGQTIIGGVTGYSTKTTLGEPLYFDLGIGEAYKIENGEIAGINNAVTIPARLPVLATGVNTITYDDTITQFRVVPRWWEV